MVCKKKNNIDVRYIKRLSEVPKDFLLTDQNKKFQKKNLSVEDLEYYNYVKNKGTDKIVIPTIESNSFSVKEGKSLKSKIKSSIDKLTRKKKSVEVEETSLEKLEKMVKEEFKVLEKTNELKNQEIESKKEKVSWFKKFKKAFVLKNKEKIDEEVSEDQSFLLKREDLLKEQKLKELMKEEERKTVQKRAKNFFKMLSKNTSKFFKSKINS